MASNLQVQYAFATPAGAGSTTIVASQAGQRIIVLQVCVIASAADNVKFQTSTGPTDITCLWPLAANGGFVLPYSQLGWFSTNIGDALLFNQSFAAPTAIQLVWCPSNT
jgi:hypothetical protein